MKITEIFITRPVMTALLMIGIVLFGVAGYRSLPVSDLPNVDYPTINVNANLPGANPDTMAAARSREKERTVYWSTPTRYPLAGSRRTRCRPPALQKPIPDPKLGS